jgi:hypothetical protein
MARHPSLTGADYDEAIIAAARCRASRSHRMDPIPPIPDSPRPTFGSLVTYRCDLCGTLRFDVVSRLTGEVIYRTYDQPDWYAEANRDRHDPSWWRTTWWETLDPSYFLEPEAPTRIDSRRRRRA